jgi:endogenous inhibitor of DNA gyrase (YacG/DUF329 family)
MLSYEMQARQCPNCQKSFKVLASSDQTYCSKLCKNDLKGEKFIGNGKKVAPMKFTSSGQMIIDERKKEFSESNPLDLWQSYVDRARKIVRAMAKDRMELAKIAIQACEIKWGGGGHWTNHDDINTLKKFADEAGISYKTISGYVRAYRNVVEKLPEDVYDDTDYAALTRTSNAVNAKTPKEKVIEVYSKEVGRKLDYSVSLYTMTKRLKTASFWLESTDLRKFKKEDLVELKKVCSSINKKLSGFL